MSSFRGKYFLDTLSAIERIGAAQSPAAIGEIITSTAASFGYGHVCFLTSAGSHQPFEERVLWQAWPKSWAEQYRSSNFYAHDPLAPRIRQQAEMFAWSDLPVDRMSPASRHVMEIAAVDYDLRFGLCAPVHGMNGYQAGLSLAGRDVERTPEANSAIELVTMYAFNRFAILRSRQQTKPAVLSARELGRRRQDGLGYERDPQHLRRHREQDGDGGDAQAQRAYARAGRSRSDQARTDHFLICQSPAHGISRPDRP
jgi:LuxR family transcriptional regulator, quorum-sensing system regulator BjaR1